MPKETFFNLDEKKKENIVEVLVDEFSTKPFKDVTVKSIVNRLKIAKGSFYQYFEDLEDSYFYILNQQTHDVHLLFMNLFLEHRGDILTSLEKFGIRVADTIFHKSRYPIYKNRYLYRNEELDKNWNLCHSERYSIFFERAEQLCRTSKMELPFQLGQKRPLRRWSKMERLQAQTGKSDLRRDQIGQRWLSYFTNYYH